MRPGLAADHSPPSSAAVMKEQSYTSTHPLGHTGPVTGTLYLLNTEVRLQILNTKQIAAIKNKAEGYCPCALMEVTAEAHKHRFITFC